MLRAFLVLLALLAPLATLRADDGVNPGTQTRYIIIDRLVWREEKGIVALNSSFTVAQTADRLRTLIELKGLTVYAEIDQAAEAKRAGRTLPPMRLILFGGPTLATPLLPEAPTLGIDLPWSILVYGVPGGGTIIVYEDPAWVARRHEIAEGSGEIRRAASLLDEIARTAGSAS